MSTEQVLQTAQILIGSGPLTQQEASLGIKEALTKGIEKGVNLSSQKDGFLKNNLIRIPWPSEAEKIKMTLNQLGLNSLTEKAETSMNRAAEQAASLALPLFVDAIKTMTITEALEIVSGGENAATNFLKLKTETKLVGQFQPHISKSLNQVEATKYWGQVINNYNKIPLVKKMNPSLDSYVTAKAIDGLFTMVAEEEKDIRTNPQARTTALLKRVFGSSNQ
jgi:hypothetical protein